MDEKILYGKETWQVYKEFQKIVNNIKEDDYKYFDEIKEMLYNEKSYIKLRGFIIICKLSKFDKQNKINNNIDLLLTILDDDKPTIIRQAINALKEIIIYKPELINVIKTKLKNINYLKYKDTMSPLIKKDIDNIIKSIDSPLRG